MSETQVVSKLEIIERHLVASIQMIALEMNPISTHVVVMACEEMVLSLADANGVPLDFDYRIYVKDEFHSQYRNKIRAPYNFFKHADRDPHANYEGPSEGDLSHANEIMTLMNAIGYTKLGGSSRRELVQHFSALMMIRKPKMFKTGWLDAYPRVKRMHEQAATEPQYALPALREILFQQSLLPRIPYPIG